VSIQPGEFQPVNRVYEDSAGRVVVQPEVVVQQQPPVRVVQTVAPAQTVRTSYWSRFAPDAVITAIVGLILLLVGLIAVTRAGTDGAMSSPVVKVLGFTHTETLGLIEIAFGIVLLICGATLARGATLFFAAVLGIGAFVGAVQEASFRKNLALESGMAWLVVLAAAVVVVSTLIMPRFVTRATRTVVQP